MTSKILCLASILLILLVGHRAGVQAQATASAQDEVIRVVSDEIYSQVLDLVFPRGALSGGGIKYAFVLRYEPSFNPESQITIAKRVDNSILVEFASADRNIDAQLNEILQRTGKQTAESMARDVKVSRQILTISPELLERLRVSFYNNLVSALQIEKKLADVNKEEVNVVADGTTYRLWYVADGDISYTLNGSDVDSPTRINDSPLLRWMKSVRATIHNLTLVRSVSKPKRHHYDFKSLTNQTASRRAFRH